MVFDNDRLRVLVISHNVFSDNTSMGKTLSSYFCGFDPDNVAQLFFHSETPSSGVCDLYYRITDKEMIKSVFFRKSGTVVSSVKDAAPLRSPRKENGVESSLYQKGRRRTPMIYFLRNLWWKLGKWNTKALRNWIDDFSPDCVFLASGDYSFAYDIALFIAKKRGIPLYISCMDDYYFNNKNSDSVFGRIVHKSFMKHVGKAVDYSNAIFCICDKMSRDYSAFFNKKCVTLHTSASFDGKLSEPKERCISYLGNLGLGRADRLVEIGRALKALNADIDHIDVYSSETRESILSKLTPENGIVFHGKIGADEVKRVIGKSLAVIHTESFGEKSENKVKYSVSTKIADSLMSGTCIFAYGPSDVASIEYLEQNGAALCVTSPEKLSEGLKTLLTDSFTVDNILVRSVELAKKNHTKMNSFNVIKSELAFLA